MLAGVLGNDLNRGSEKWIFGFSILCQMVPKNIWTTQNRNHNFLSRFWAFRIVCHQQKKTCKKLLCYAKIVAIRKFSRVRVLGIELCKENNKRAENEKLVAACSSTGNHHVVCSKSCGVPPSHVMTTGTHPIARVIFNSLLIF